MVCLPFVPFLQNQFVGLLVFCHLEALLKELRAYLKGMGKDALSVSLLSADSLSGSGHDDSDSIGNVFIWGEGTDDGILGGGIYKLENTPRFTTDSYVPKALEPEVLLDVQNIACGERHAALVTKKGEVFSWGEELGGRLGHGVDSDVSHPKLVDSLKNINIELVACGEHHSCAVSLSGDLYTWGGSARNFGILGHGNEVSLWVPKKVNGPLEGICVSSVSCGPWHTAVVTSAGQLFTFGDGTFGVLGHGDRISVSTPREVVALKGLRAVRAACGVWHTAAVVDVMVGTSSSGNRSSGKLFTWGDGDKNRLGHGDKEAKLVPCCVAALVDHDFCQVACGASLTVALTTTGHVCTMGSPVYGQLGNPKADGKLPTRVEGKLMKNFVEEIACGAYHVAVLTTRSEVYSWGKGANGQLGHGDMDDRNSPSLIEALKNKQVKKIACGTNFTSAICLVSGSDLSMCSRCQLPFNLKRKRHNCYNCGRVYCHSCSSKKSLKVSMAPNLNKPYRVCDTCFNKLADDLSEEDVENQFQASITTSRGDGISSGVTTETNSSPHRTTSTPALSELASQQIVEDEAQWTTDALSEEEIELRAKSGHDLGEVSEQQLTQRSVNAGSSNMSPRNQSRNMNQSRSINSLSIDIKEEDNEDDELRDHFAFKVTADRAFVIINFIVEVPSAVFDQLSSMRKPQYALASLILSFVALLFCIIELFYKGGLERVAWRWNEKIPWFYYPSPSQRPFGNVIDFIGLICGILQFIVATNTYALYLQHADNPIEISLWPLAFASCLLICKFLNNPHKKTL